MMNQKEKIRLKNISISEKRAKSILYSKFLLNWKDMNKYEFLILFMRSLNQLNLIQVRCATIA